MDPYDDKWFEAALNAMSDMVIIKGPNSQLLWGNQTFLDYYQMTCADLQNIVDGPQSDPDDTLQYVRDDQTVFDTSEHLDIPNETVTDAGGTPRSWHTIKSPIIEDGKVVRSIGISRLIENPEIKRRTINHEDAKAFVAPLKTLTRSFPTPMIMVDVKKRVVHSSPLWDRHIGQPGNTPNEFFDKIYPELSGVSEKIDECLDQKARVSELLDLRKTGGDNVYSVQISPWMYPDETIGGATVIATDITELQDRTQALQRLNDELVQFSYRASHDLKGPLSTTKGLARFISKDIADGNVDESAKNAQKIEKLMSRLETTVSSILSLAKSDLVDEEYGLVNLEEIVSQTCDGLAIQIELAGVQIRTHLEVREFVSQHTRLSQIVENLISNAVKYHSPDETESYIAISSAQTISGVEICIEDNGIGIPETARDKVFELFTRFHTDYEGSGLGLSIVKKHIDAMHGTIRLEHLQKGTQFRILIPGEQPIE